MVASGNLGVPLLDWGVPSFLAVEWGELQVEHSPGISNMGFDKRSVIFSVRLGPVTTSLGHSVTECGEGTGVNNHRGTASRESPWVVLGRVIHN